MWFVLYFLWVVCITILMMVNNVEFDVINFTLYTVWIVLIGIGCDTI